MMQPWRRLPIGSDFPLTTYRTLIVGVGSAADGVAHFSFSWQCCLRMLTLSDSVNPDD